MTASPAAASSTQPTAGSTAAEPDVRAVAAAVESCPSVSRLSGGAGGEIATYLPGDRVNGIRVRDDEDGSGRKVVTVSVVAVWDAPSRSVGDEVRAAVRTAGGPGVSRVDVSIDDVDVPEELARRLGLLPEPEPEEPATEPAQLPAVTAAPAAGALPPLGADVPAVPGPSSSPTTAVPPPTIV